MSFTTSVPLSAARRLKDPSVHSQLTWITLTKVQSAQTFHSIVVWTNAINWSHWFYFASAIFSNTGRTTEQENTAPWSPCRLSKEARHIWKPNYAPISISSSPHHILVLVRSDHSAVKHVRNPCITVLAETKRLSSECMEWTNKCLGSRMTTSPEAAGTELILDITPYRPYLLLLRFWHWNLFFLVWSPMAWTCLRCWAAGG